jgi:hypothetical protein
MKDEGRKKPKIEKWGISGHPKTILTIANPTIQPET